jgi:hypothetical protein
MANKMAKNIKKDSKSASWFTSPAPLPSSVEFFFVWQHNPDKEPPFHYAIGLWPSTCSDQERPGATRSDQERPDNFFGNFHRKFVFFFFWFRVLIFA